MLVKLLNGDLISVDSNDLESVKCTIAIHLSADVDDVQLVSCDDDGTTVFAMIIKRPRWVELDLSDQKVIDQICIQISNPKFINTSLIEYFLSHIVDLPHRVTVSTKTFAANPHPLIVEYLVSSF